MSHDPATLFIETHGCQMNEYDSGIVRTILGNSGFQTVQDPAHAGVILINTCAVREKAHEKIYGRLQSLMYLKRRHPGTVIGLLGCMAQNLGEDLFQRGLDLDLVVGPDGYRELPGLIRRIREERKQIRLTDLSTTETYDDIEPAVLQGKSAFVTVMRGCNNFCSFCVVPYTRGRERSRAPESIIAEVNHLIEKHGIGEVTLLGQNVNSYRYDSVDFTGLVRSLLRESGIARIRFTSPHPHDFPEDLLDLMGSEPRFCSHIHLPVQSGSSAVLKRMKRDYDREEFLDLVDTIRARVPGVALTTDVIAGFCGETEEQFQETLSLLERVRFDMAFMFKYSERQMTVASRLYPDDVPEEVKLDRLNRIIELQTSLSAAVNQDEVGRVHRVMVEGVSRRSSHEMTGRTEHNKVVVFPVAEDEKPPEQGEIVEIRITSSSSATLRGESVKVAPSSPSSH